MSTVPTKKSNRAFDRSICFSNFESQVNAVKQIEASQGAETALRAYFILADYCLYGIEPDPASNPWGFAWALVKQQASTSIKNRARGFGSEDTEKTEAILEYMGENPHASRREVAQAVGCSVGKVQKVASSGPYTHSLDDTRSHDHSHNLNHSREREREHDGPSLASPAGSDASPSPRLATLDGGAVENLPPKSMNSTEPKEAPND